ncbi:unnamed protein product [Prorocentrum cordatum]|uniref:Uncharacterized protein n=1 Tax=Prorocentrum cordatum TaxID=2364126 RepID=A0ABN9VWE1_9DINO|nr:unnamed protein product [Polarella glacialis]
MGRSATWTAVCFLAEEMLLGENVRAEHVAPLRKLELAGRTIMMKKLDRTMHKFFVQRELAGLQLAPLPEDDQDLCSTMLSGRTDRPHEEFYWLFVGVVSVCLRPKLPRKVRPWLQ